MDRLCSRPPSSAVFLLLSPRPHGTARRTVPVNLAFDQHTLPRGRSNRPGRAAPSPASPDAPLGPRPDPPHPLPPVPGATPRWLDSLLVLLVAVFAFFLASFPARNGDLWMHLAAGRLVAEGRGLFGAEAALPSGLEV